MELGTRNGPLMIDALLARLEAVYAPEALATLALGVFGGFLVFALIERLAPARPPDLRGFGVSLRCSIAYHLLAPMAAALPAVAVYELLGSWHGDEHAIALNLQVLAYWWDAPESLPYQPSTAAILLFAFAGMFVYDFFYYWFHRLQHTRLLWAQHRLHHADAHLSVATSYRHHWLEDALRGLLLTLPMGLVLNLTTLQVVWLAYLLPQFGHFIHTNLRLELGPLTPLMVGPQLHRIHHSIDPRHRDKNFAAYFPVWDLLFGTYHRPAKGEFPDTGVAGVASAVTWRAMLAWPWGRRRIEGQST